MELVGKGVGGAGSVGACFSTGLRGVYWRRNGLELGGMGASDDGSVYVD